MRAIVAYILRGNSFEIHLNILSHTPQEMCKPRISQAAFPNMTVFCLLSEKTRASDPPTPLSPAGFLLSMTTPSPNRRAGTELEDSTTSCSHWYDLKSQTLTLINIRKCRFKLKPSCPPPSGATGVQQHPEHNRRRRGQRPRIPSHGDLFRSMDRPRSHLHALLTQHPLLQQRHQL